MLLWFLCARHAVHDDLRDVSVVDMETLSIPSYIYLHLDPNDSRHLTTRISSELHRWKRSGTAADVSVSLPQNVPHQVAIKRLILFTPSFSAPAKVWYGDVTTLKAKKGRGKDSETVFLWPKGMKRIEKACEDSEHKGFPWVKRLSAACWHQVGHPRNHLHQLTHWSHPQEAPCPDTNLGQIIYNGLRRRQNGQSQDLEMRCSLCFLGFLKQLGTPTFANSETLAVALQITPQVWNTLRNRSWISDCS